MQQDAPIPTPLTFVFIGYASEDKPIARMLRHRLERLGIKTWFDEETLHAGEAFPERLRLELERSSHLLLVLTEKWFTKEWTREELRLFLAAKAPGPAPVIPVLIEPMNVPELAGLDGRSRINVAGATEDEVDWQLWCAIMSTPLGPRSEWPRRVRQVRLESPLTADFTDAEYLEQIRGALEGRAFTEIQACHWAWHSLRLGISPAWLETIWSAEEARVAYIRFIARASSANVQARGLAWSSVARVARRLESLPISPDAAKLLAALNDSTTDREALALVDLLGRSSLSQNDARALLRWMDPDLAGDAFDADRAPQIKGFEAAMTRALSLLSSRADQDPCEWFRGLDSLQLSEAWWWSAYFRELMSWAKADPERQTAVAARLHLQLQLAEGDSETLSGMAIALGSLNAIPLSWTAIATTVHRAYRGVRGQAPSRARLDLLRALLAADPKFVFFELSSQLDLFEPWGACVEAASLLGEAASNAEELKELLRRLAFARDPEPRALLFDACLASRARAESEPDAGDAHASQSDMLTLKRAIASDNWIAHLAGDDWFELATEGESTEVRLAAFVAAHRLADSSSLHPPEFRWRVLRRALVVCMAQLTREASAHLGARRADWPAHPEGDQLDQWLGWWGAVGRDIGELGRDALQTADVFDDRLRQLQLALAAAPSLNSTARMLAEAIDDCLVFTPRSARAFMARPSRTYRHMPTRDPAFSKLLSLLKAPGVTGPVANLVSEGQEKVSALTQALQELIRLDAQRQIAFGLHSLEAMLRLLPSFLSANAVSWSRPILWSLLRRPIAFPVPGTTVDAFDRALSDALAQDYASTPSELSADADRLPAIDLELKLQVACGALRQDLAALRPFAVDVFRELRQLETEDASLLDEFLTAWERATPTPELAPSLVDLLAETSNERVRLSAARALLRSLPTGSQLHAVVQSALAYPALRDRLSDALEEYGQADLRAS